MKIHSNFKDYYDVGLKYLLDDEPVFIRNQIISLNPSQYYFQIKDSFSSIGMIYFCGDYYPFVFQWTIENRSYFYSKEKYLENYKIKNIESLESIFNPNFRYKYLSFIDPVYSIMKEKLDLFKDSNPIALIEFKTGGVETFINPILKEYQFNKIVDPFTAIHKLNTFLCNQARPENPTIIINDKDLAKSKGFDEWSFRKMGKNSK